MSAYKRKDHYWKKAKQEGYRSRAAYKLLDMQKKYRIVRKGASVLDLGCAPGGWVQVLAEAVGPTGRVFGVDRSPVQSFPCSWITLFQGDVSDPGFRQDLLKNLEGVIHVVTSDMAPDLSGVGFRDHCRSCELVETAFSLAGSVLSPGGTFLAKVFQGGELETLINELSGAFQRVKRVVPSASRKASAEIYLLAEGFSSR